jgi:hypothetical protein
MAFQILLRGFRRAPVGRQGGKFADDQAFNIRLGRFFILAIGADVPDMRIGKTNNLSGITGIGENFLIAGETGIENDFATAAGGGTRGASVKDSSVLERENRATYEGLGQCVLQKEILSFGCRVDGGSSSEGSEMVHRPISEDGFAVDVRARNGSKDA